jgi:hypothetical protein
MVVMRNVILFGFLWSTKLEIICRCGKSTLVNGRTSSFNKICFVLNSDYSVSFFKALIGIIFLIAYIFKAFIWGESEESRKINWIKWEKFVLKRRVEG